MNALYPIDAEQFRVPPHTRLVLKRRDGEPGCWHQVTLARRAGSRVTVNLLNHQNEGLRFVIDLAAGGVLLNRDTCLKEWAFQRLMMGIGTAGAVLDAYERRYE
jgi:hypothetical protein